MSHDKLMSDIASGKEVFFENTFEEFVLEKGFYILHFQNQSNTVENFEREIDSSYIQIHFCLKGNSKFLFNNGNYSFDVLDNRSILLYNPQRVLPINLEIQPKTTLISLLISSTIVKLTSGSPSVLK